jgi:CheY-like chemotaxis protein
MKIIFNHVCLLISNNLSDQEIFGRALKEVSPETVYCVATNGQEAFDMIAHGHLIPDIIFVELDMPDMNGVEFLTRLKGIPAFKSIPVIVHTKLSKPDKHHEILEAGALAIYSKAYEFEGVSRILYLYGLLDLYRIPNLALLHLN